MKIYIVGFISLVLSSYSQEQVSFKNDANIKDKIPAVVLCLSTISNSKAIPETKIANSNQAVSFPIKQCKRWIQKVLDPSWQPKETLQITCLQKIEEGRDVVLMSWKHKNASVEVCQTASIFLMKITPKDKLGDRNNAKKNLQKTKTLLFAILAKKTVKWTDQGEKIVVDNLHEKIEEASFKTIFSEKIISKDNSVLLAGITPKDRGLVSLEGDCELWFNNVNWWNNGTSLYLYFLKTEGGSWIPSYAGNIDKNWFSVKKSP